jgi:hypothetical protein
MDTTSLHTLALIRESLPALCGAFGVSTIRIQRRCEPDGTKRWRVVALLPPDFPYIPAVCLWHFDEGWWLANCHRSRGDVVFEYALDGEQ